MGGGHGRTLSSMGAHRRGEGEGEGEEGQGARPRGCCRGGAMGGMGGGQGVGSSVLVSLLYCSLPEAAVREEGSRNQGGRRRE
jgi:hypothetical protein